MSLLLLLRSPTGGGSPDVLVTASWSSALTMTVAPSAPIAPDVLVTAGWSSALTMTVLVTVQRSRRRAPRREYVWIHDVVGEQVGVIR